MKSASQLIIFEATNQPVQVRLEGETLWLSQAQMAQLFDTSTDNISLHLKNIYSQGELEEKATTEDFSVVRQEGSRQVQRRIKHYNLDTIISIGYRVNSTRATRFRQWVTQVLRQHLTQGYSLDRERFEKNAAELEAALLLVRKVAAGQALTADLGRGLVDVIARYTHTFLWLQRYDEGLLTTPEGSPGGVLPTLAEAQAAIARLKADLVARGEASDLFGRERGDAFAALLGNLDQSAFGEPVYPTVECKAAHLISSSKTTRLSMVTSAAALFCLWTFWRAMAACCVMVRQSSTMWGWPRWRCWWPNQTRKTRR